MMRRGTIVADGSAYRKPRPFLVVALLTDDSDHGPLLMPHLVNALANLEHALIAMSWYANHNAERLLLHPA